MLLVELIRRLDDIRNVLQRQDPSANPEVVVIDDPPMMAIDISRIRIGDDGTVQLVVEVT